MYLNQFVFDFFMPIAPGFYLKDGIWYERVWGGPDISHQIFGPGTFPTPYIYGPLSIQPPIPQELNLTPEQKKDLEKMLEGLDISCFSPKHKKK